MRILNVVGARPNFMKIGPIHALMESDEAFDPVLLHTGQHYDERMSDIFFRELGLPEPDIHLGVGSGTHAEQTARIMLGFEKVVVEQSPDLVLVVGDVNSTIACALVAAKRHIPVGHVEAGLRSFDREMPEEINRIVTDSLSDLLFVTEQSGIDNLKNEGTEEKKIHFVGNVMIDSLIKHRKKAREVDILDQLEVRALGYVLMTIHRPTNVDNGSSLANVLDIVEEVAASYPIVFPMHPRTLARIESNGFRERLDAVPGLKLVEPLGYLDFLRLMDDAAGVVTDSGGIQEETTYLHVPCLTLRDNTERPVTVTMGTNELCPLDPEVVGRRLAQWSGGARRNGEAPPLWDGHAAERIVDVLKDR